MANSDEFLIESTDPLGPEAAELIRGLSAELALRYDHVDSGSRQFRPEEVTGPGSVFLVGRLGSLAVACGALRPLEPGVGEVKRMFVTPDCRGRSYARRVLAELERWADKLGYHALRLETGERLTEAIRLYERAGYRRIENYGIYVAAGRSVCFEKTLRP
jgi:GNAT superfamily N-acetyltransferase